MIYTFIGGLRCTFEFRKAEVSDDAVLALRIIVSVSITIKVFPLEDVTSVIARIGEFFE